MFCVSVEKTVSEKLILILNKYLKRTLVTQLKNIFKFVKLAKKFIYCVPTKISIFVIKITLVPL